MGGRQTKPNIDYRQHETHFNTVAKDCQAGPVQQRSCNDLCCLVLFIIMTLFFVGSGIYFIASIDASDFQKFSTVMATPPKASNSNVTPTFTPSTPPPTNPTINPATPPNVTPTNTPTTPGAKNPATPPNVTPTNTPTTPGAINPTITPTITPTRSHMLKDDHFGYSNHWQTTTNTTKTKQMKFPNLIPAVPTIIIMGLFSLVVSLVIIIAISKFAKCLVYSMIGITFLIIFGGIIAGPILQIYELTAISAFIGIIWFISLAVLFCCFRGQMEAALTLLKVTANFLREKPSILLAPFFTLLITVFYFAFWIVSLIGIQLDRSPENIQNLTTPSDPKTAGTSGTINSTTKQPQYKGDIHDVFTAIWMCLNIFYSYFLYYVMVFLIATATALWYYGIESNYIITGLKNLWKGHIGSLTFASMLVTIIQILKNQAQSNQNENGASAICKCIVRCCLSIIEELIQVLNHNSIIVMSLTGEGFIDSAKNSIYLIFNNFGLFVAVELVERIIGACVMAFTILLPTGLGLLLLKFTYNQGKDEEDIYLIICMFILFCVCLIVSLLTTTILSQVLSCVFLFYCIDDRFRNLNFGAVNRVPGDLRGLFSQIESEGRSINSDQYPRNSNPKQPNYY